jgi:hypothetical protein
MASEQEKVAYLEEHVSYEVVMLNYTFMRLMTSQSSTPEEQLEFNAFLESFAVHARNLVEFLCNKAEDEARSACDYIPAFEAPNQAGVVQALFRLENQILRMSALRTTGPQGKFDIDDARELYGWLVPAILKFQGELSPLYRGNLNALGQVAGSKHAKDN